jgi:Domain of unknown function (DUF4190)
MGTSGEHGEGQEKQGGWQSGGWQSQWQPPGEQPAWQGGQQPPPQQTGPGGWTQTPDGRWVQTAPTSSGKATASLVLGILGLVFCPLICSVLALVFGYQSRNEIDASGGRIGGRGNATAGVVLGWIGVAICVLFLILIVIGLLAGDSNSGGGSPSGVPA